MSAQGKTFASHEWIQVSYFNFKILVFAEPGHMLFFSNPITRFLVKNFVFSVITLTLSAT